MLVGITGYAGSGKDTAALALLNNGFERRAFADPLRAGLLGIDPWLPVTRSGSPVQAAASSVARTNVV